MQTTFSALRECRARRPVAETAVNLRFHHAMSSKAKLRIYASFLYQAGSWRRPRKVVARLECSLQPIETGLRQEVDIRYAGQGPPRPKAFCRFAIAAGRTPNAIRIERPAEASYRYARGRFRSIIYREA